MGDASDTDADEGADASGMTKREGAGRPRVASPDVATDDGTDAASQPASQAEPTDLTRQERPATSRPVEPHLDRGTAVGRYILLDVLGAGGMGVVYTAYDPELDRKVAVKLLQAKSATGSDGQAWMLREAQALARLSHPNVVAVYDVGSLPGDRVFIAMERVDGTTLRAWLRETPRPWRQVVAVMLAAGAGLAAAHAAGLVHRDFKPDNIIVGSDGRVRVMDFGLARLQLERGDATEPPQGRDSDPLIESRSPLSASLTTAGSVMGTPAYMAPELYTGVAADTRADQFSFGVALYEGLFRARPFKKDGTKHRAEPLKPPADTDVPARVQRIAMRAISLDPGARFAAMDDLLAALAAEVAPRRRLLIACAAAVGVALAVAGGFVVMSSSSKPEVCTGIDRRLAGVWDDATRQAVRTAFDATKRPLAAKTFARVERQLDAVAAEWTATATDSCTATQIRAEQSEEVWSLRQACLDERLDELGALTALLAHADAELVDGADKLVGGLQSISRCSNVTALRAPGQPPTEPKDKVDELRTKLADAEVQILAGRYAAALPEADRIVALADEVHYPPHKAEGLRMRGTALAGVGRSDEAAAACQEAAAVATAARADMPLIGALLCAAVATPRDKPGEAKIWLALAGATLARPGNHDAQLELRLLEFEAVVAAEGGDKTVTLAAQQKALEAATKLFGADNPSLWWDEDIIAIGYAQGGAYDNARPHFERAIALREQGQGESGADFPLILSNLGACYSRTGEPDKARATYERALAIQERDDTNPVSLALTLNNMADGLDKAGESSGAMVYSERARGLVENQLGRRNPLYHAVATTHAETLAALGRLADARTEYDDVVALETKGSSPYLGATLNSRAEVELGAKQWADAVTFEKRAIAAVEAASGKDAPEEWQSVAGLGRATLELGHRAEGRVLLEHAVALGEKAEASAADLEPTRALLKQLAP